jgi:hypothetical protein
MNHKNGRFEHENALFGQKNFVEILEMFAVPASRQQKKGA